MRVHRLCVEHDLTAGETLQLAGDTAHYIGRVLRCKTGDRVALFNGDGREFPSRIEQVTKHAVTLVVGQAVTTSTGSVLDLRLIQGISRGERMDLVVQKATELGVRRISPVLCEFSVVRLDRERGEKRRRHWSRIVANACEQCGRSELPLLDAPCALSGLLAVPPGGPVTRLVLAPGATTTFDSVAGAPERVELLVGPEGGLSDAEQAQAAAAGFVGVSLGPRTLRTETAAITALALAQARWGDLCGTQPARRA